MISATAERQHSRCTDAAGVGTGGEALEGAGGGAVLIEGKTTGTCVLKRDGQ